MFLVAQAAGLLEAAFWPQWHAVLGHWLANAPDMDQVVAWFSGWKQLLPQVCCELTTCLAHTNMASAPVWAAPPVAGWLA